MRRACVATAMLLGGLAGCATPCGPVVTPAPAPLVWPRPPDAPRVRLLGEVRRDAGDPPSPGFWQVVFYGRPEPRVMSHPYAVAVHADGNRVAVADTHGACVHVYDLERRTHVWLEACGAAGDGLQCPVGVAWAGDSLCVADSKRHGLAIYGAGGDGRWVGRDVLKRPAGLAWCAKTGVLYVSDAAEHALFGFERSGTVVGRFGSRGSEAGQFNTPGGVACGPDDRIAVADSLNFRVQLLGLDGSPIGVFGRKGDAAGDLALPKGVAFDAQGNLWVVDAQFENVQAFSPKGELLMAFGQEGRGPGEFWLPAGICIDARHRMWVADCYNRRIQVFALVE